MLDIDASLKDTKFWQNINFYLVLIACNGKWKSSLKYVYKYENVLSIVWNVTLVTHITEYRKSTSVPRSPAPNEVRILTSIMMLERNYCQAQVKVKFIWFNLTHPSQHFSVTLSLNLSILQHTWKLIYISKGLYAQGIWRSAVQPLVDNLGWIQT